jgi:dTDP-glucose 4,6-dehydratase
MRPLHPQDLDHVLKHTAGLWEALRGRRLFITGGTGFFGIWLAESFLHANERLDLGAKALLLSRDPGGFLRRAPHLAGRTAIAFLEGDMGRFAFPRGTFACVVHAATETVRGQDPLEIFERNVDGTRRVLEFARRAGAARLLFTSSGAVYGRQPPDLPLLSEDHPGAPPTMDVAAAYGNSKRFSEFLCAAHARRHGTVTTIARCFAFVGPHLPLDANYAIGNFIRDALAGGPIRVQGDGTPRRSYLYAADLAIWLWTILLRGESCRAYNVGSEQDVGIADLARIVAAAVNPAAAVEVAGRPEAAGAPERYVPEARRAREELGLSAWIPLAEGIRRTAAWHAGSPRAEVRR